MFSSRLHWDLRPNRLAELLEARRRSGAPVLDLTESNPTRAGFDYPTEAILEALANPGALLYEPVPAGLAVARQAVSAYYAARGHAVEPDRIILTTGTSEAYAHVFKLLADPGDAVLVPRPSYPLFEFLATLESVRLIQYPLVYHGGWALDLDALPHVLTSRARAVVVVNPNNPTGSFLKQDELEALIRLCARYGVALISDEVFSDYAFTPNPRRVASLTGVSDVLTFCLNGLSKIAGLPQMKLGWMVLAGPAALREAACARLELIADTYLSVGTPVQHALPRLFAAGAAVQRQIAARTAENLAFLRDSIPPDSPCRLLAVEGGWYATLRVPRTRSEEAWCLELLEQDGVLVQPGYFYDFESEAFLVISLLTPLKAFRVGVGRLLARCAV